MNEVTLNFFFPQIHRKYIIKETASLFTNLHFNTISITTTTIISKFLHTLKQLQLVSNPIATNES